MASTREVEIRFVGRLVIDDKTRAALIALGWTPPREHCGGSEAGCTECADMQEWADAVKRGESSDVLPPEAAP